MLTIGLASTSTIGALSDTDWDIFNNKQDAFGSQTANTFYAAPNGSDGIPAFRALVDADIPNTITIDAATAATNLKGGAFNKIPFQTAENTTGFIGAPSDGQILKYTTGGGIAWSDAPSTMVYPGAGIAVSTGSAWGTSITDNSENWNTAFGWGDHSTAGYVKPTYTSLATGDLLKYDGTKWINFVPSYLTSYTETDPIVKAITGIVKSNGSTISEAVAGTDYLAPFTAQTANTIFAGPTTGSDATPTFRALVDDDIPNNITITNLSGTNSGDVTLAGENYLSITNQVITANAVNLGTSNITGTLPVGNGGTGATTESDARTNLGLAIGTNVQAYDADLTTLGGLSSADGNFIVGSATGWTVESGATARTSLGLATVASTGSYNDLSNTPSSLPPSGDAGGDLTGTYPNPTIADGKITSAKIVDNNVTNAKIEDTDLKSLANLNASAANKIVASTATANSYTLLNAPTASGQMLVYNGSSLTWATNSENTISSKSADYLIEATDGTVLVDATGGNITVTLPAASTVTGKKFIIKKKDSSSNLVIIDADGSETIDGAATMSIGLQYQGFIIQSDGSGWYIVGKL